MAGLLDFLNTDDARLGLGLLAAGGPSAVPMSVGQRVAGALQGMDADKQNKMKLQLLQSQIDENATQNQLRQAQVAQQAKRDAYYMGDGGLAGGAAMGAPGMSAGPGSAPMGGAPAVGGAPGSAGAGGDRFSQWSAQYGIPRDALVNDYLTNGGKGIAEMLMKRGTPDMQVSNGYAYDKNRLPGGFMPQVNTSADGKTSMILPNGSGGVNVQAPQGALPTFQAYQSASNRSQADYQPETVVDTTPGPNFGQKKVLPRSQVLQPNGPSSDPSAGAPRGAFTGTPEQIIAAINTIPAGPERERARQAYANQVTGNNPAFSAGNSGALPPNNVVELSPATQNEIAANKEYGTGVAKDQVEQRKNIVSAGFQAPGRIAKLQQIDKLLGDFEGGKLSQTGVDFASSMNSLGIKVDKNLPNKEAAMAMSREIALSLRNPAGGAGMPGAMSDADRNFLSSMTPDIGQTADGRRQIIRAGVAVETRNQQVAEFARKYESKYGKLDNGFYSQLSNWSSANPLFGK